VVGTILVLDQLTKVAVDRSLALHQSIPVIEGFFHLTHVRNTGAAFGFLANAPEGFRIPFFFIATGIAIGALLVFLRRVDTDTPFLLLALSSVLGGALGNLLDRLHYGEVVDFLDFHWRGYYWPAFNVADICITLGVIGLFLYSFLDEKKGIIGHARIDEGEGSL
jgi:signal peptidase II